MMWIKQPNWHEPYRWNGDMQLAFDMAAANMAMLYLCRCPIMDDQVVLLPWGKGAPQFIKG